MAYAIVDFVKLGEVEVVPSSWVTADICMWPKAPLSKIKTMVKKNLPCSYSPPWHRYTVCVKGLFATYDEARKKLDRSQYTSDLTSDDELPQKRRRFPTSTWEHCENSSDSAPTESDASLPVVPASFPQGKAELHHQGHLWYLSHLACIDQLHAAPAMSPDLRFSRTWALFFLSDNCITRAICGI
ncbi:hypothetical protein HPB50_028837 [Hyalomma asiaticum]|nr:hypothetical protein HPB50_028837 [Hyalomma asiaticum]